MANLMPVPRYVDWVVIRCPSCNYERRPGLLARDVIRPDGLREIAFQCLSCSTSVVTRTSGRVTDQTVWSW